jgi:hypothetical protein
LERSFSQPSYTELPAKVVGAAGLSGKATRLFFHDPQRTRDGQTPLVYLNYLESDDPIEFSSEGDFETRGWTVSENRSGITSLTYTRKDELRAVNLSAREFFGVLPGQDLVFRQRRVIHLPFFLALIILYSAKLVFLLRFRRGGRD